MTVKKKHSWYENSPPPPPQVPAKPIPYWSHQVIDEVWSGECVKLSDIELPDGVKLEDLIVQEHGDDASYASVGIAREVKTPNPSFEREMKRYELALQKHEAALKAWEDDVKQWQQWKDEKEKSALEVRLKAAETLLKKHGRLK